MDMTRTDPENSDAALLSSKSLYTLTIMEEDGSESFEKRVDADQDTLVGDGCLGDSDGEPIVIQANDLNYNRCNFYLQPSVSPTSYNGDIHRHAKCDTDSLALSIPPAPARQISRQLSMSKRRGSRHVFTVLNYGASNINDVPPASITPNTVVSAERIWQARTNTATGSLHSNHSNSLESVDFSGVWGNREHGIKGAEGHSCGEDTNSEMEYRIDMPAISEETGLSEDMTVNRKLSSMSGEKAPKSKDTINGSLQKYLPIVDILRRGRIFAKRKQKRLVLKNGEANVYMSNVDKKRMSFIRDMFTTLLDLKWRYLGILFVLAFLLTWMLFAVIWYLFYITEPRMEIADIDIINNTNTALNRREHIPCLLGVKSFSAALLLSIETQQTIGYGTRSVSEECPLAIIFMMIQSLLGVLLCCVMTGLIFAKFARPKLRRTTVLFSKVAVICERDGERCLMFRVGDMRKNHMANVIIKAMLIRPYKTLENEVINHYHHNLHVETDAEDFFFLAWPIRVIHKIDKKSPLWKMSSENLLGGEFELVVVLEGTNQSSGQSTQIRTSYLPGEIMWGHRMKPLIISSEQHSKYHIDYTRFHETVPVLMGEYSAEEFEQKKLSNEAIEKKLGIYQSAA